MRFLDYIKLAFKNISRRKLRSALTIVSIVIGALSVVTVLTLMVTAKSVFYKQLESEGMFTEVTVMQNADNMGGPFQPENQPDTDKEQKIDAEAIKDFKEIDHVIEANAEQDIWSFKYIKAPNGDGKNKRSRFLAYEPGAATDKKMVAGRNFTAEDGKGKVIINADTAEQLGFEEPTDALGQKVVFITEKGYGGDGADIPGPNAPKEEWDTRSEKVYEISGEVVGITVPPTIGDGSGVYLPMKWGEKVLAWYNWEFQEDEMEKFKQRMERQGNMNWNDKDCQQCFVLKEESQIDKNGYSTVYVKVDDLDNTKAVAEEIKKMGFPAITAEDMIAMFTKIANIVASIFAAIGGISLGVATIGIVNTMLMATYERTREIGVMRACGAKRRTIRRLFMFEAATIGFFGGVVGIVIAEIIIFIANRYLNNMLLSEGMAGENLAVLPLWLVLATMGITTLLGVLSGLYPATRAARVNPVEALRFE